MIGIYKIVCLTNGKIYIGSSVNVELRLRKHKEALRRGKHGNRHLQNAYNKYGVDSFSFETIEQVNDVGLVLEREQFWMDCLQTADREKGFNINSQASSTLGLKKTQEAKNKIAKAWVVTTPENIEIETINLSKFCKDNNLSQASLNSVANGVIGQYKGWKCRHADISAEDWQTLVANKSKNKWHLIDPQGREHWVRSKDMDEFCNANNLSMHSLRDVNRGRKKNIKGWTAKYCGKKVYRDPKCGGKLSKESIAKIKSKLSKCWIVTDPQGNEHSIDNLNEFCTMNDLNADMIAVANGTQDYCKGWKCRRANISREEWVIIRESKRKPRDSNSNKWLVVSPEGLQQEIINLRKFCTENNLCDDLMRSLNKGRIEYYKGWKCNKLVDRAG